MNKESILTSKATGISVAELFQSQAIKNPQALAVINLNGDNYTYRTFLLRVLKLSTVLIKKGIKPKDRISILSENRLEYLELEMACAKIGAILATINWRLADKEVDYCISLVKPKLIFFSFQIFFFIVFLTNGAFHGVTNTSLLKFLICPCPRLIMALHPR